MVNSAAAVRRCVVKLEKAKTVTVLYLTYLYTWIVDIFTSTAWFLTIAMKSTFSFWFLPNEMLYSTFRVLLSSVVGLCIVLLKKERNYLVNWIMDSPKHHHAVQRLQDLLPIMLVAVGNPMVISVIGIVGCIVSCIHGNQSSWIARLIKALLVAGGEWREAVSEIVWIDPSFYRWWYQHL